MSFWKRDRAVPLVINAAPENYPEPVVVEAPAPKLGELNTLLEQLKAERDAVLAVCEPLEAERKAAYELSFEYTAKAKAAGEKIAALKTPRYREVCNMIAALTRAVSPTKSLAAGAGEFK